MGMIFVLSSLFSPIMSSIPSNLFPSVESPVVAGNSFTHSYPDWREGTYENFKDWAAKQFQLKEKDSDDEAEVPVHMQKAKNISFERNEKGFLILPPRMDFKTNRQRQRVIRGYIGAAYSKAILFFFLLFLNYTIGDFTGNQNAAFPYALAFKENQNIYSEDSAPKDFRLSDPDHLTMDKIDSLYIHLLGRQRNGLEPFIIINSSPAHPPAVKKSVKALGKRKADYVDVGTDDDDGDEEVGTDDGGADEEIRSSPLKTGPPKKKTRISSSAGPSTLQEAISPPTKPKKKESKLPNVASGSNSRRGLRSNKVCLQVIKFFIIMF